MRLARDAAQFPDFNAGLAASMREETNRALDELIWQPGRSFLDLVYDSDAATEVTLQPLKRFPNLDAAILFSDILIVPFAIGQNLSFVTSEGPRLTPPLISSDLDDLTPYLARLEPVYETVRKVKTALPAGKTLIKQGDPGRELFLALRGG